MFLFSNKEVTINQGDKTKDGFLKKESGIKNRMERQMGSINFFIYLYI